jgi:hypothetical protein
VSRAGNKYIERRVVPCVCFYIFIGREAKITLFSRRVSAFRFRCVVAAAAILIAAEELRSVPVN